MKEFIKIGDYYVKDKQAREDIEGLKEDLKNLPTGTGALPKVDEKDNGKVLQVNNGQWDKGFLDFATWNAFKHGGFNVYPHSEGNEEDAVYILGASGALENRIPWYAVTGDTMDYAWKECATNFEGDTWTDEEKLSACQTIGAVHKLPLHIVFFGALTAENVSNLLWSGVYLYYRSSEGNIAYDVGAIANQLYKAGYNSIMNIAPAFDKTNNGHLYLMDIVGMYSTDGVNLSIMRVNGNTHVAVLTGNLALHHQMSYK